MPVPFHGDTILLVGKDNEPFVAMRSIVVNMGLDWASQYTKLKANKERWGVVNITTPSVSGVQDTVCIPFRKLAAWLYSISPNKVAPTLREKIIQYQEECDEVLWHHWTKDRSQYIAELEEQAKRILPIQGVKRTAREGINFKQLLILQEQAHSFEKLLDAATGRFERQGLHNRLRQVNDALGVPTPPLEPRPAAVQQAEMSPTS